MNALEHALALAAQGIPVFPCQADKRPLQGTHGFKDASRDPATIRALFANPAAALVGVPTGAVSGLDVLDLDPRHGSDSWWEANQRRIPATLIHTTRSGGMHLVFKHQPGLRCSVGALAAGCDVRADGGYVVWWPADGCEVWLGEDPAPWPAWLLAGLTTRTTTTTAEPRGVAPPSAAAVVELLNRLPNPLAAGRDLYARVMLAAAGCVQALDADDGGTIADAAVGWAERWEGYDGADERAKWESDWSTRDAPKAGWPTLLQVARNLIPGFVDVTAGGEFDPLPPLPPARRRVMTPGECEGVTSRPYRVKGLLADRDVGCLFGPPGAGKSLLAPLLAYRLAQGEPFFGLRTRAGPALYVAAEDESGMERRVNALRLAHGDVPGFGLVKGVCDLLNPSSGDLAWLLAEVEHRRPALIVIDTLAMAFPGLIENDADGMGRVVAVARQLTQHGAAVLLVHHDTKARDGTPRGHSLLNGALDMAICLDPKDAAGVVRGRLTKNRNGSCEHDMAFRIGVRMLGADQDGDPITAAVAVELDGVEAGAKPPKLSDGQAAALGALVKCMATDAAPAADGQQAVPEEAWMAACATLSTAETPKDRARSARRMRRDLVEKGAVHAVGEMFRPVQPVRSTGHGGTVGGPTQGIEFIEGTEGDEGGPSEDRPRGTGGPRGPIPIGSVPRSPQPVLLMEGAGA